MTPKSGKAMGAVSERAIQRAIVQYLTVALPRTVKFFSTLNGLHTSKAQAGKAKAEGMTPGVPDIVLVRQGGSVAFMEVKTPQGRLSPAQVAFFDWCVANGVEAAVVRSIDDARAALNAWNVEVRA